MKFSLLLVAACFASLVGCASKDVKPIALQTALDDMQEGLAQSALTLLEIESESPKAGHPSPVYTKLARFQCGLDLDGKPILMKDGTPKIATKNPIIPLVNGAIQVQVQGQVQGQVQLAVAFIPIGPTLTSSHTRQDQEQFMLPVSLVTLSELPGYYLNQELPTLQAAAVLSAPPDKEKSVPAPPPDDQTVLAGKLVTQQSARVVYNLSVLTTAALEQFATNQANYCQSVAALEPAPLAKSPEENATMSVVRVPLLLPSTVGGFALPP